MSDSPLSPLLISHPLAELPWARHSQRLSADTHGPWVVAAEVFFPRNKCESDDPAEQVQALRSANWDFFCFVSLLEAVGFESNGPGAWLCSW